MVRPLQVIRLLYINLTLMRHTLTRPLLGQQSKLLWLLSYINPWSFNQQAVSRGQSIRLALESLGPIFIKFGQILSTRQDLFDEDISNELAKLQDQVPPFPGSLAQTIIEQTFQQPLHCLFNQFNLTPLASASIAQVHTAHLIDGSDVVVKILRPDIEKIIRRDIALLYSVARLVERWWSQGKRLRPVALVAEFEQTILDELDLSREAANAAQLKRNFRDSTLLYVPKVHWEFVRPNILVIERIYGTRISDLATLKARQTNLKKLAERGVEIFFTQVFRDNFFHADMHPGNLFVDITDPENPRYLGVDFGIMGNLSPRDQQYLAENLLAFFNRDYREVALLHVESGWVPSNTRIDQLEAAIRTVSEPIFEKPLNEISFGKLLLHLFTTAERFNMEMQPQLMLLQKTLLSIEGLGRQLYPQLDLWNTAKPFMERWLKQQYGLKHFMQTAYQEFSHNSTELIKIPRVITHAFNSWQQQLIAMQRQTPPPSHLWRGILIGVGLSMIVILTSYWLLNN